MDLSGQVGPRLVTIVVLDFEWRAVVELAVKSFLVEPRDPCTRGDFEIVKALPVTSVVGERGGVAVQFGLVEGVDRFRQGIGPLRQLHPNQLVRSGLFA